MASVLAAATPNVLLVTDPMAEPPRQSSCPSRASSDGALSFRSPDNTSGGSGAPKIARPATNTIGTGGDRPRPRSYDAPRHHDDVARFQNDLVALVEGEHPEFDDPAVRMRPGRSGLGDAPLDAQRVTDAHGQPPLHRLDRHARPLSAEAEVTVDDEPHRHGGGVPTAGDEPPERRPPRRLLVQMGRLRIELRGEGLDALRGQSHRARGPEAKANRELLEAARRGHRHVGFHVPYQGA